MRTWTTKTFPFAIVLLLTQSLFVSANDADLTELERYYWLENDGMFDEEVTNEEIHELIVAGLKHDDPKIVDATVSAMGFYLASVRSYLEVGVPPLIDRQLQGIPGLYDILINMWDENWAAVGGVMPSLVFSMETGKKFIETGKGSMMPRPAWAGLPSMLPVLFPGDEKVYEIVWEVYSPEYHGGLPDTLRLSEPNAMGEVSTIGKNTNNPAPLLAALFHGKFSHPRDQRFRIDILTHEKSIRIFSSLAARSLGDFRSEDGLEALVSVLQRDKRNAPTIQIVEAMIKYGEEATPYIPQMRARLEKARAFDSVERDLKATLRERLFHFANKFGKYAEEVEPSLP